MRFLIDFRCGSRFWHGPCPRRKRQQSETSTRTWKGEGAMDANKQGGRVRSLFGLLLPSADSWWPPVLGASLVLVPGTVRPKAMAVVLLIGIASPFLG